MKSRKTILIIAAVVVVVLAVLIGLNLRSAIRYNYAQNQLSAGRFKQAGEAFGALGGYEESSQLSMYSRACAAAEEGDFYTAAQAFESLGDYKDCKLLAAYYTARQSEDSGEYYTRSYLSAIREFKSIYLFRDAREHIDRCYEKAYDAADKEGGNGDYEAAVYVLKNLDSYKDSRTLASYYSACSELSGENYKEALKMFGELGEYRDSAEKLELTREAAYRKAEEYLSEEKYSKAYDLFETLGSYSDSAERIKASKYERAEKWLAEMNYEEAYAMFEELGDYSDAKTRIQQSKYERAEAYLNDGEYFYAYVLFGEISDYKDAAERVLKSKYDRAEALMASYYFDDAAELYAEIGDYADAAEKLSSITNAKKRKLAEDNITAGNYLEARNLYLELQDEESANECSYLYAGSVEDETPWVAWKEFTALGDYKDSADRAAGLYSRRYEFIGETDGNGLKIFYDSASGYGLLDENADVVIEPRYGAIQNGYKGNYMVLLGGKAGVIKPDGEILVDLVYSGISTTDNERYMVKNADDEYGLLDAEGGIITDCLYSSIRFSEADELYLVEGKNGRGLLKADGSVLVPAEYSGISKAEDGYLVISGKKEGFLKKDGSVIVPPSYDEITILEDGRFLVEKDGKNGLLSADGETVVSPLYDAVEIMEDGRFLVTSGGLKGILDADGKGIITPAYGSIILENTGNYTVTLNGKSGIVSYEGKVLHEADMEEIRAGSNDGKYMIFRQDGLYGFMKADTFEVTVPAEWKDAHIMYDGYAYILNNLDQWGVIDASGNVTVTPMWSSIKWYEDCGHAMAGNILLDNRGRSVCDFSPYNNYVYWYDNYLGNGVFGDADENECLYDTKTGKTYSFEIEGYDVKDLKLYDGGLLTGNIPYKSGYSVKRAYGVIDSVNLKTISTNRWEKITGIPGTASYGGKYGWIGKDGRDLLDPTYDYIDDVTYNGKIIAANYNDRGNLVYVVIDDTTGKILQSGFATKEEAIEFCGSDAEQEPMHG